ncbi:MAG: hypothetical protein ABI415_05770 [Flavitalea sp.]
MKTYTLFLDTIILSLLLFAVHFNLSDSMITNLRTSRAGVMHTMIISWQSLIFVAGFCLVLRYIARNTR